MECMQSAEHVVHFNNNELFKNYISNSEIKFYMNLSILFGTIRQKASVFYVIANMNYAEFVNLVDKSNDMYKLIFPKYEEPLQMTIVENTCSGVLWRFKGRVKLERFQPSSMELVSSRELSITEFVRLHRQLRMFTNIFLSKSKPGSVSQDVKLNDVNILEADECSVCLERPPDQVLPCAHAYCEACLQQWKFIHAESPIDPTCPVCREDSGLTKSEPWNLVNCPDPQDLTESIQLQVKLLFDRAGMPAIMAVPVEKKTN